MKRVHVPVTDSIAVGDGEPLLIVAGPCVIESKELCRTIAAHVAEVCMELGVNFVFKASFERQTGPAWTRSGALALKQDSRYSVRLAKNLQCR